MKRCPHCGTAQNLLRYGAPAFPMTCRVCGGTYHATGTIAGIVVGSVGLTIALATVVLTNRLWLGGVAVTAVFLVLMVLTRKVRLVPSTPAVVRKSRLAIAALLLLVVVFEVWERTAWRW
jgi:hypothetical protein